MVNKDIFIDVLELTSIAMLDGITAACFAGIFYCLRKIYSGSN
jgi:hypothetical protein